MVLPGGGFTSARTSTIGGRSMRARSTSITWQAPFTRTCGGGRRWRYQPVRCSSCPSARRSRSSRSCARTWRKPTSSPTVIRSVGPTVVFTVLLDGPHLASRWAARYASVLADDPGSVVLTLTSFGMVQRSRPPGRETSPIVALLKDAEHGFREIPLEPGAQAVLLTACGSRAIRRTADGRRPVDTGTHYFGAAVHQIRASDAGSNSLSADAGATLPRVLDVDDLTVLTGWAEAVAETLAHAPKRIPALVGRCLPGRCLAIRARDRRALAAARRGDRISQ
jgi:hypothetical protein